MTTELGYLFATTVLVAVLWIPYIVGNVMSAGLLTREEYRVGRHVQFPHWVRRADRAHINLVEQFGPFAALVVIAHLTGVHNAVTVWCVAIFFWARIVHAIVYFGGFGIFMIRTVAFTVAFTALLVYAWQIYMYAAPVAA